MKKQLLIKALAGALFAVSFFTQDLKAQLILSKNLPAVGTTWHSIAKTQFSSILPTPPSAAPGINQTWDYDSFYNSMGTEYPSGNFEVIAKSSLSQQLQDSVPNATFIVRNTSALGTITNFYEEQADTLWNIANKSDTNPVNVLTSPLKYFVFNAPLNFVLNGQKYTGSGTLKIAGHTFNDVALFETVEFQPGITDTRQYAFYQISPYFLQVALLTFNDATKNYLVNIWVPDNMVSINEIENTTKLNIYPNPSNGNIILQADQFDTYQIFDMQGRLVNNFQVEKGEQSLQLSLNKGVYFMRSLQGGKSQKIIIQ